MNEVFISTCTDTASNLSFEELLFERVSPGSVQLFLYINGPSVVFGKNQNPWLEIDVPMCRRKGIPLFRRISGGGTVFHDPGNLNFSFIMDKALYDKEKNIALIRSALEAVGIESEQSRRGDILVQGRKISGNAMNIKKERVLHHGTLLLDADLDDLRGVLCGTQYRSDFPYAIETKAVKSVSSPVINLKMINNELSMDGLLDAAVDAFTKEYAPEKPPEYVDTAAAAAERRDITEKYGSWEWTFGRTPQCSFQMTEPGKSMDARLILHVEKGCISRIEGMPLTETLKGRLISLPLKRTAVEALLGDRSLMNNGGAAALRALSAILMDLAQY